MKFDVDLLLQFNPDHFTVEDVARTLKMWKWYARRVIKTAVRRGDFGKDHDDNGEFYYLRMKRNFGCNYEK